MLKRKIFLFLLVLITLSCTEDLGPGKFSTELTGLGVPGSGEEPSTGAPGTTPTPRPPGTSPWITRSTYQQVTNSDSASNGMGTDSSGNLYSVGYGTSGNVKNWIVRRSTNRGASWTLVDNFNYSDGMDAIALGFGADRNGGIYVVGSGSTQSTDPVNYWVVRKSTDAGMTWKTVDTYTGAAGFPSEATAVAVAPNGRIYVTGTIHNGSIYKWPVRVSTDNGATWTTTSTYETFSSARGFGIDTDASNNVFIAGHGSNGDKKTWLVAKSSDGGLTWTQNDSWQLDANFDSEPRALVVDGRNRPYVSGYGKNASGSHWIVRRGNPSTDTYTTVDNYDHPNDTAVASNSMARGIAFDRLNNMYVVGFASTNVGTQKMASIIRRSTTNGISFVTVDDHQPGSGNTSATGITLDSGNRVYIGGVTDIGTRAWFIRSNQ